MKRRTFAKLLALVTFGLAARLNAQPIGQVPCPFAPGHGCP